MTAPVFKHERQPVIPFACSRKKNHLFVERRRRTGKLNTGQNRGEDAAAGTVSQSAATAGHEAEG